MEEYLNEQISRMERKIEELENEKKRLQNTPIKRTTTYDYVEDIRKNSDTGQLQSWGKKYGVREVPAYEVMENIRQRISKINEQIKEIYAEMRPIKDKLLKIEWDKPENVAKRQQETTKKNIEEQKEQLQKERLEHEARYDDLNKLVEYLDMAGLNDLARRLSQLRFAFQNPKSDYINKEIDLQSKEQSFRTKVQTTKKEYKEIKRSVIKLNKEATRNAKKYKDLYNLYRNAWKIVQDIEDKGISKMPGQKLYDALKNYFTQPTGEYLFRDYGSYYSRKESENLGYQYLAFYRDYGSKYNEDVRKHKI